ncbi:hypothetical protein TRFO_09958 [Tritrichomonas foetus]|uniref:MINDY deubiquitinase domain-containing protein n=1 Tax=Tritrichomonas foetus TaxID=1144522 RepID=A0A1J4JCE3_9EUKA|nr:hypothetical protein TRFO_09958 [Tritrichomonas foetus]|eukprot:OHS96329.1 hypothetical protein TRFO_09958 [Tritrichomonas foetus]
MSSHQLYQTRTFFFPILNRNVTILMQTRNGPCLLLAIFNALALKGQISIDPGVYSSSAVVDFIRGCCPKAKGLRKMKKGYIVNPRFGGCLLFEKIPSFLKELDLKIVHSMVPREKSEGYSIISKHDCESLQLRLMELDCEDQHINNNHVMNNNHEINNNHEMNNNYLMNNNSDSSSNNSLLACFEMLVNECSSQNSEDLMKNNNEITENNMKENKINYPNDSILEKPKNMNRNPDEKKILLEWNKKVQYQVTNYGISLIRNTMKEDDIFIYFRASHFSVIYKHNNHIFNLITAHSYLGTRSVWQSLPRVNGDVQYFDENFRCYTNMSYAPTGKVEGNKVIPTTELQDNQSDGHGCNIA